MKIILFFSLPSLLAQGMLRKKSQNDAKKEEVIEMERQIDVAAMFVKCDALARKVGFFVEIAPCDFKVVKEYGGDHVFKGPEIRELYIFLLGMNVDRE